MIRKKSQLALFVFLSLILSFTLVLFYVSKNKEVLNYQFKSEKIIKQMYIKKIKTNYINHLNTLVESQKFYFLTTYCFEGKDFFFLKAIKKEDFLKNKENLYKKNLFEECIRNKEFNFSSKILKFYLENLKKKELTIEENKFLFFDKPIKKTYFFIQNKKIFKVVCEYKEYIKVNFYLPNLLKKEIYSNQIPLIICYYEEKTKVENKIPKIYLDNIEVFFIIDFFVYNNSLDNKKNDMKNFEYEIKNLINTNPKIKKELENYGITEINKNDISSLSLHKYKKIKIQDSNYFIPSKNFVIKEENDKYYLISYFLLY